MTCDLAARINAEGKQADRKTLHRFLDGLLLIDDSATAVYRAVVDRPGKVNLRSVGWRRRSQLPQDCP